MNQLCYFFLMLFRPQLILLPPTAHNLEIFWLLIISFPWKISRLWMKEVPREKTVERFGNEFSRNKIERGWKLLNSFPGNQQQVHDRSMLRGFIGNSSIDPDPASKKLLWTWLTSEAVREKENKDAASLVRSKFLSECWIVIIKHHPFPASLGKFHRKYTSRWNFPKKKGNGWCFIITIQHSERNLLTRTYLSWNLLFSSYYLLFKVPWQGSAGGRVITFQQL